MTEDNRPQIPKIDETRPVVWTAEDASRFLTSAIHEAQKPLAEALKQRPITSKALTMIVAVLVVAALVIALILSSQLEKTEKRAEAMQAAHNEILSEKANLQAQSSTLQDRLTAINDQQVDLRGQIENLRQNEEKHKRTQLDLSRYRRQNELLRSQISGLEMEKVALARQLEAVKALAEADPEADPADEASGPFDSSDPALQIGSGSPAATPAATDAEAPEETVTAVAPDAPAAETGSPVAEDSRQLIIDKYSSSPVQPADDAAVAAEQDETPEDTAINGDDGAVEENRGDAGDEAATPASSEDGDERFEPGLTPAQKETPSAAEQAVAPEESAGTLETDDASPETAGNASAGTEAAVEEDAPAAEEVSSGEAAIVPEQTEESVEDTATAEPENDEPAVDTAPDTASETSSHSIPAAQAEEGIAQDGEEPVEANEYVTLDPDASVPAIQAEEAGTETKAEAETENAELQ